MDGLITDRLNLIQRILTAKVCNNDVDEFYQRMVAEKRIDVFVGKKQNKSTKNGKDLQMNDLNNIRNKGARRLVPNGCRSRLYANYRKPRFWRRTATKK